MSVYQMSEQTNRISKDILDAAFIVHNELGPGLLESVYEQCLAHVLVKKGLKVEKQKILPVKFQDIYIEAGFRLDLLVEDQVIVEIKSHEKILPIHEAQLYTYMKLADKPLGLILNFNSKQLKDGIKRLAMTANLTKNFA